MTLNDTESTFPIIWQHFKSCDSQWNLILSTGLQCTQGFFAMFFKMSFILQVITFKKSLSLLFFQSLHGLAFTTFSDLFYKCGSLLWGDIFQPHSIVCISIICCKQVTLKVTLVFKVHYFLWSPLNIKDLLAQMVE